MIYIYDIYDIYVYDIYIYIIMYLYSYILLMLYSFTSYRWIAIFRVSVLPYFSLTGKRSKEFDYLDRHTQTTQKLQQMMVTLEAANVAGKSLSFIGK